MISRPVGVGPNPISAAAHQRVRRTAKARPRTKRVEEKEEEPTPNELLMQRMKARGVKPDPDHTGA